MKKKLELKKEVVSELTGKQMNRVVGGFVETNYPCPSYDLIPENPCMATHDYTCLYCQGTNTCGGGEISVEACETEPGNLTDWCLETDRCLEPETKYC